MRPSTLFTEADRLYVVRFFTLLYNKLASCFTKRIITPIAIVWPVVVGEMAQREDETFLYTATLCFDTMSDDNPDPDEFVSWLCWMWAQDGERFYPPDETAMECLEALSDDDTNAIEHDVMYEREYAEHCRAYTEAVSKFRDASMWGFDPIERAAREHRDLLNRAEHAEEIGPIDWTWLGDHKTFVNSMVPNVEVDDDGE